MERNDNDKLEKTSDFLALMTRSERKAWERAKQEEKEKVVVDSYLAKEKTRKTREDKKLSEEIEKQETTPLTPISIEETSPIDITNTSALQVGEIAKTQSFTDLPNEVVATLQDQKQEEFFQPTPPPKKKKSFQPLPWIGLIIMLCFGYFLYLGIGSSYEESLLLFIDGAFLLGMVFLLGMAILCNQKGMKIFSGINFILFLLFLLVNGFFLFSEKDSQEEPEKVLAKKEITCLSTTKNEQQILKTENNYLMVLTRKETFETEEEMETVKNFFQETEGLTIETDIETKTLTITFDFQKLDINKYKVMIRSYLESRRELADFSYIQDEKVLYQTYLKGLNNYSCEEKKIR